MTEKWRLFGSCTQESSGLDFGPDCGAVPPSPLARAQLPAQHSSIATKGEVNLQSVSEELVHLGKLGGDAEVNCPVANLNNEPTDDIGVDLERC